MPRVSVVIPNYNGEYYLRDCVESIMIQEYKDYEVIIIDNASQDSKYEWLQKYKEIIFKKLDKNYGFSKAVNEGIKLSKGEYVLLLNNDTVLEKDFIGEMVQAIEENSRIFGVSSKMISYDNHQIMDDAGDEYSIIGWAYKIGDGDSVENYMKSYKVFSACAGAALYRKKVFDEIGLFDESFFAYLEDVDISYRARIHGYYNIYCPKAKVYHKGSATSGGRYNSFKIKISGRNNIYLAYKNMPFFQLIVNSPCLIMGTLVKGLVFRKKGYGKDYMDGVKEGLRTIGRVAKEPFQMKHLIHYCCIEILLIKNTIKYIMMRSRNTRSSQERSRRLME